MDPAIENATYLNRKVNQHFADAFARAVARTRSSITVNGRPLKPPLAPVDRTAEAADSLRRCYVSLDDALYRTPSDPCGQIQAAMDHLENYVECVEARR